MLSKNGGCRGTQLNPLYPFSGVGALKAEWVWYEVEVILYHQTIPAYRDSVRVQGRYKTVPQKKNK